MRVLALVGALALSGCAVPYAQIDSGYQSAARTKDEVISRAWYLACKRDAFESVVARHGQTEELWNSFLNVCGFAGRPAPLPRPQGEIQESLGVDSESTGAYLEPIPDDGGPIYFGTIE